jgi:predicted nucleotidyltransferase component of viral defense system
MKSEDLRRLVTELSAKTKLEQAVVEKTIRMSQILEDISTKPELSMLAFKGGTALNFIYLKDLKRLSVDLDFNAIGRKDELLEARDRMISPTVNAIAKDMRYTIEVNKSYFRYGYRFHYNNLNGQDDYVKIEISFRDRVCVLPIKECKFQFPQLEKIISVRALSFIELFAEKLRALYTREKGRDLFDVYNAINLVKPSMKNILRKTLIYKLFRAEPPAVFKPKDFIEKVKNFQKKRYDHALENFVLEESQVSYDEAKTKTVKKLEFLHEIDKQDEIFIGLFRCLLGKDVSKDKIKQIREKDDLMKPLDYLYEGKEITKMAKETKLAEISPVIEAPLKKYPWLGNFLRTG